MELSILYHVAQKYVMSISKNNPLQPPKTIDLSCRIFRRNSYNNESCQKQKDPHLPQCFLIISKVIQKSVLSFISASFI